ncbi:phage/plasmid primase, P4 family [Bradyrhizobium sp. USDA 10063]
MPDDDNVVPMPTGGKLADRSEQGVMREFIRRSKERLRYHHQRKQWFVWHDNYWKADGKQLAFADALDLCREIKDKPAQKVRFAAAVELAARAQVEVATEADEWDRDRLLVGTPDGVVDLRTGEMRGGRPCDLISKVTLVSPSDDAECPVFDEFIAFALDGDADNIAFLDRYLGYCLTGLTCEEFLLFLYGKEGTGKGTLTKTVMNIMHQYARAVPIEMFTDKSTKQEYYRADLSGYRFIVASEPAKGAAWNEAFVNEATGSDIMSGRHPSGRPFDFDPTHKLVIHGNAVPDLKAAASGLKRRLGILPFSRVPNNPDHGLKEKLRAEYPAILRRMINGCLAYQRQGLAIPANVRAATSEYFERQDRLSRFVADECDLLPTARERAGVMLQAYNQWADHNGERRLNASGFHDLIENASDPTIRNATGHARASFVQGLVLKSKNGKWHG